MKKLYEQPVMKIAAFDSDIITTSGISGKSLTEQIGGQTAKSVGADSYSNISAQLGN